MEATDFVVKTALDETGSTSDLSDREKQLIGLAVTLTRGCQACTGGRLENALNSGIPYTSIRAAIDLVAAVNAGVVLRTAIEGTARNSLQDQCTGVECGTNP